MNRERVSAVLLGGAVALVGLPLVVGPLVGGWLAGRRTDHPIVAGGVAGLLGAAPWGAVVYLATLGRLPQVGYHTDLVHVGINPAPPGLFTPLQSLAVAALLVGTVLAWACVGGAVARLGEGEVLGPLREATRGI